jgi:hypothetical protein
VSRLIYFMFSQGRLPYQVKSFVKYIKLHFTTYTICLATIYQMIFCVLIMFFFPTQIWNAT